MNELEILHKICSKIGATFRLTWTDEKYSLIIVPSNGASFSVENLKKENFVSELYRIGTFFGVDL